MTRNCCSWLSTASILNNRLFKWCCVCDKERWLLKRNISKWNSVEFCQKIVRLGNIFTNRFVVHAFHSHRTGGGECSWCLMRTGDTQYIHTSTWTTNKVHIEWVSCRKKNGRHSCEIKRNRQNEIFTAANPCLILWTLFHYLPEFMCFWR